MLGYVVKRFGSMLVMLAGLSVMVFLLFSVLPADPARLTCGKTCTPDVVEANRQRLGLDKPLVEQYAVPLDDSVAAACASYQRDLAATLDRLARAYLDFVAAQPLYYRFELASGFAARASDAHRSTRVHQARRRTAIEQLFRAATAEHGNMRGRERRYAVSLVGHINSYVALHLDDELVITDRVRHDLLHQFSHGIYS